MPGRTAGADGTRPLQRSAPMSAGVGMGMGVGGGSGAGRGARSGPEAYVFLCNNRTQPECERRKLLGLGQKELREMQSITNATSIYLYNFETHVLHGVLQADGRPGVCVCVRACVGG